MTPQDKLNYAENRLALAEQEGNQREISKWARYVRYWRAVLVLTSILQSDKVDA